MLRIIGVGDNTVDTYVQSRVRFPGGNAVNVAVLAGRLGAHAAYLGALGDDERGRLIFDSLTAEGLDLSHTRMLPGAENAWAEVNLVDGERVFGRYSSGAAALLRLSADDLAYIRGFDAVHSSIYSFLEEQKQELRAASCFLSFDFSSHLEEMPLIKSWLPFVDLAILSLSENPQLEPESAARQLKESGAGLVMVTRGEQGAWLYDGVQMYHQGIIPTRVVDTMGAGDAFIAAFLMEYLAGGGIPAALLKGALYAAQNCRQEGAFGYKQPF